MKLVIRPSPGARVTVFLKDGQKVVQDDIDRVEVTPFFSIHNGPGAAIEGDSINVHGKTLDQFTLIASGSNGKVKLQPRVAESVVPTVDRALRTTPAAPATPPAAAKT